MYGRVSNHEIIIPYLPSFVGSGIRRVWRGRGVIVGVCEEGVGVSSECGDGVGVSVWRGGWVCETKVDYQLC